VNSDVFEPASEAPRPIASVRTENRLPSLNSLSSTDQLDETELGARLILNQLHADTGEQIDVHRTEYAVEVVGLVETEDRKDLLRRQLGIVPRLKVSIQSAADARSAPVAESQEVQIESAALSDFPSSLDIYMKAHGHSVNEINAAASQFLGHALAISHESKALADLASRFRPDETRPVITSATVTNLLYSHRERLDVALSEQQVLMDRVEGANKVEAWQPCRGLNGKELTVNDHAARHLSLVHELTQTSSQSSRSAAEIFSEMTIVMDCLKAAAGDFYSESQRAAAQSGKE
jgi:hypothetical protein